MEQAIASKAATQLKMGLVQQFAARFEDSSGSRDSLAHPKQIVAGFPGQVAGGIARFDAFSQNAPYTVATATQGPGAKQKRKYAAETIRAAPSLDFEFSFASPIAVSATDVKIHTAHSTTRAQPTQVNFEFSPAIRITSGGLTSQDGSHAGAAATRQKRQQPAEQRLAKSAILQNQQLKKKQKQQIQKKKQSQRPWNSSTVMSAHQLKMLTPFSAAEFVRARNSANAADAEVLQNLLAQRLDQVLGKCVAPDKTSRHSLCEGLLESFTATQVAEMIEKTEKSHMKATS